MGNKFETRRVSHGLPKIKPSLVDLFGQGFNKMPLNLDGRTDAMAELRATVIKNTLDALIQDIFWNKKAWDNCFEYRIFGSYYGMPFKEIGIRFSQIDGKLVGHVFVVNHMSELEINITDLEHDVHALLRGHWPYLMGQLKAKGFEKSS